MRQVVHNILLKCCTGLRLLFPLLWSHCDCSFVAGPESTSLLPTHLSSVIGKSDWSITSSENESNSRDTDSLSLKRKIKIMHNTQNVSVTYSLKHKENRTKESLTNDYPISIIIYYIIISILCNLINLHI